MSGPPLIPHADTNGTGVLSRQLHHTALADAVIVRDHVPTGLSNRGDHTGMQALTISGTPPLPRSAANRAETRRRAGSPDLSMARDYMPARLRSHGSARNDIPPASSISDDIVDIGQNPYASITDPRGSPAATGPSRQNHSAPAIAA